VPDRIALSPAALALSVLVALLVAAFLVLFFATWTKSSGDKQPPKVVVPAHTR
jgi:hypothetical protein